MTTDTTNEVITNHIDRAFLADALKKAAEERADRAAADTAEREKRRIGWSKITAEKLAKVGIIVGPATGQFTQDEYIEFEVDGLIFQQPGNRVFVRIAPQRLPDVDEYTITKHWKNIASVSWADSATAAADLALEIAKLEENFEAGWASYRAALANPTPEVKPEPEPELSVKFLVCHDITAYQDRTEFEHELAQHIADGWQIKSEHQSAAMNEHERVVVYTVMLVKKETQKTPQEESDYEDPAGTDESNCLGTRNDTDFTVATYDPIAHLNK